MIILGVNAYHADASACLLRDGELVAAAEEERFRRVKHWAGFPAQAIRYCLDTARLSLGDVDHLAVNSDARAQIGRKLRFAIVHRPRLGNIAGRLRHGRKRRDIAEALAREFPEARLRARVHRVEHHLAHLISCFYVSPFEEAVAVSIDGFGDFASAAWGLGRDSSVAVEGRVYFPHSLGIFYQALTQYLGFTSYGDEYKVMGLAAYGRPRYMDALRQLLQLTEDGCFRLDLRYFRHHREGVQYSWDEGAPVVGTLYSARLVELLGPARTSTEPLQGRHEDIAHSIQAVYEEALFNLLNALHSRYDVDQLALAGGCAMNSVANGRVRERTPFRRLYVQPAAGDAGGALGAALAVWQVAGTGAGRFPMEHAYWGPGFDEATVDAEIASRSDELRASGCTVSQVVDEEQLCELTANAISRGLVVGWFQGRMEWGPRALGNRSILCDPRRTDMKEILNRKIKRRESFRPFAPSILREVVGDWFVADDDVPFMMKVFGIRSERRSDIPAVTHVDGTGRLQTVDRSANPRFYRLIEKFRDITGVPMVLNTSFNENEPIVCHPSEALDCFLRTRMDVLVLGNRFLSRLA
jgi:carbamoyltransferase